MADDIQTSIVYLRHLSRNSPQRHRHHFGLVVNLIEAQQAEIERLRVLTQDLVCLLPHFRLAIPCKAPADTTLDEWCSECAVIARWEALRG